MGFEEMDNLVEKTIGNKYHAIFKKRKNQMSRDSIDF